MGEIRERERQQGDERELAVVPSIAAGLFRPTPWASEMAASMTASEPTIATASAAEPSRIAGTMERDDHRKADRAAIPAPR